jgi:CRISPR-associated protein Csm3
MIEKKHKTIHITGEIITLSRMHIGECDTGSNEYGLKCIARDQITGKPYIPASTIKGLLRSMTVRTGPGLATDITPSNELTKKGNTSVAGMLFGTSFDTTTGQSNQGRLFVMDCHLLSKEGDTGNRGHLGNDTMVLCSIDRDSNCPETRFLEYIMPGTSFKLEIFVTIYENENAAKVMQLVKNSIQLMERELLGSFGSHGFGRIQIEELMIESDIDERRG